nr:unnamed protein product [Callosobruchus analis]
MDYQGLEDILNVYVEHWLTNGQYSKYPLK